MISCSIYRSYKVSGNISVERFGFSEESGSSKNKQNVLSLLYKVLKTISIVIVWLAIVSGYGCN